MKATPEQLEALVQLQELDRQSLKAKLELQKLPQKAAIEQTRAKRVEIGKKIEQIEKIYRDAERDFNRLNEEDEHQAERQKITQQKIDEEKGDYRAVTSLTRDLEGMMKRRETLEFEMGKADKKLSEIATVREQAAQAAATLEAREAKLMGDYRAAVDALRVQIDDAVDRRDDAAGAVPAELLKAYEETARKCGGIALARLQDNRCGTCRSVIESNRLLQIKREAPLSRCPSCKRLLIVE